MSCFALVVGCPIWERTRGKEKSRRKNKKTRKTTTTMSEMRKTFLVFCFFTMISRPMDESQEKNCKHSSSLHGHVPDIVSFNFSFLCVHYFLPFIHLLIEFLSFLLLCRLCLDFSRELRIENENWKFRQFLFTFSDTQLLYKCGNMYL